MLSQSWILALGLRIWLSWSLPRVWHYLSLVGCYPGHTVEQDNWGYSCGRWVPCFTQSCFIQRKGSDVRQQDHWDQTQNDSSRRGQLFLNATVRLMAKQKKRRQFQITTSCSESHWANLGAHRNLHCGIQWYLNGLWDMLGKLDFEQSNDRCCFRWCLDFH